MRSGTSFFNATIYRKTLSRWWLLGLGYAAVLTYRLLDRAGGGFDFYTLYPDRNAALLNEGLCSLFPALFAVGMVMAVVGWLHRLRGSAFVAALPVRRETVFVSNLAAGLTLLLAAPAVTAALIFLLCGGGGGFGAGLLIWLGITELMTVAYYGFAAFCAVLTGNWLVFPALYFILLYAAVALESSLRRIVQFLVFGLSGQKWVITVLSPAYYLRTNVYALVSSEAFRDTDTNFVQYDTAFLGWPTVMCYAAAGILFALIAVAVLRRRRMECAGDVAAAPWLRPVFRLGAAVAVSLSAGLLTLRSIFGYTGYAVASGSFSRSVILLFMMLLGAFVGWFGAEMLLRRTVRVFDKRWGGFGILAAVIAALVLGCELDVPGVEKTIPDPSRVLRAEVTCYAAGVYTTSFTDPEDIAAVEELHRHVIENKSVFERENRTSYSGGFLEIGYYGEDGLLLVRSYAAPGGALAWASRGNALEAAEWGTENPVLKELEALVNRPEARAERNRIPDWLEISPLTASFSSIYVNEGAAGWSPIRDLTADEMCDLVENAVLPDLRDTSMGCLKLMPEGQITYPVGNVVLNFMFGQYGEGMDDRWWYLDATNTPDSRRTNAWLEEHGVHLDENGLVVSIDEEMKP